MKRRQLKKLLLLIGLFVIFLYTFNWGYKLYLRSKLQGVYFFNWSDSKSLKKMKVKIGNQCFLIPENYTWSRSARGGDFFETSAINLHALYPSMEGVTDENQKLFDGLENNQEIFFSLRKAFKHKEKSAFGKIIKEMSALEWRIKVKIDDYPLEIESDQKAVNLRRYLSDYHAWRFELKKKSDTGKIVMHMDRDHITHVEWDRELYLHKNKKNKIDYFARCYTKNAGAKPSCEAVIELSRKDNLLLNYSFSRKYLNQWKAVEEKMEKLVNGFEIPCFKGGK